MSDEQRFPAAGEAGRRDDGDRGFRLMFEASPGALMVIDGAGTIQHANAEAGRIFGYFSGELLGRPVDMLLADRSRAETGTVLAAMERPLPLGAGRELDGRDKTGAWFPVEIGTRAIETPAGRRIVIAVLDASGRKGREAGATVPAEQLDAQLREAHHRARSNLQIIQSLLDWQSPRIRDAGAAELLRESRNRIQSIAMIHQMLSQARSAASIEFQIFLAQLVPALVGSYRGEAAGINLKLEAGGVTLPSKPAVPCALLITELVSNALKHALPHTGGTIEIALRKRDGAAYELSVADDGLGIPDSVAIEAPTTAGLQLVGLLAKQLKSAMSVRRSGPTRFEFRFEVPS
ncbi:MAG TPA: histidine kinase dimerization/phosphoacceptor domain -containing protein [Alphaproteobacteria bacterium]|nr:histidine kinase dimerization/phosphoacceptor domain -containing protein [Alphaproteobacteria bacterium]